MFNRKWLSSMAALFAVIMVAMMIMTPASAGAQARITADCATPTPLPDTQVTAEGDCGQGRQYANIGLQARVNPNITVQVGQPMSYELSAVNFGPSIATNVEAGIPIDLGNLKLTGASFTDVSGYVIAILDQPDINLMVAHLADRLEPGQKATATFTFVPQSIALGLTLRGTTSNNAIAYSIAIYEDDAQGGVAISNRVEYTVAEAASSDNTKDQIQQCETNPAQKNPINGVDVRCRNFAPGERIRFWINAPGGVVVGSSSIDYVDETGLYGFNNFDVTQQELPAGDYSIVFHGDYSGVDMVFPFTVK